MRSAVCFSFPVETVPESSMVESVTFTLTLLLESRGSLLNFSWMVLCRLEESLDAGWSLAGKLLEPEAELELRLSVCAVGAVVPLLVWVPLAAEVFPAMLPAALGAVLPLAVVVGVVLVLPPVEVAVLVLEASFPGDPLAVGLTPCSPAAFLSASGVVFFASAVVSACVSVLAAALVLATFRRLWTDFTPSTDMATSFACATASAVSTLPISVTTPLLTWNRTLASVGSEANLSCSCWVKALLPAFVFDVASAASLLLDSLFADSAPVVSCAGVLLLSSGLVWAAGSVCCAGS